MHNQKQIDVAVLAAFTLASGVLIVVGGLFAPGTLAHRVACFVFSVA
jgi:hypothetical protein